METCQNTILLIGVDQVHLQAKTQNLRARLPLPRLQTKTSPKDIQDQVPPQNLAQDPVHVVQGQVLNLVLILPGQDPGPLTRTVIQEAVHEIIHLNDLGDTPMTVPTTVLKTVHEIVHETTRQGKATVQGDYYAVYFECTCYEPKFPS